MLSIFYFIWLVLHVVMRAWRLTTSNVKHGSSNVLNDFKDASRFRDETGSKNSPKKLAILEGKSQLGSNLPNSPRPPKTQTLHPEAGASRAAGPVPGGGAAIPHPQCSQQNDQKWVRFRHIRLQGFFALSYERGIPSLVSP